MCPFSERFDEKVLVSLRCRKMIMTQVLSTLLQDGFGSLEDLPENVRNDMLLELAKLAGEGKLSGRVQGVLNEIFLTFPRSL